MPMPDRTTRVVIDEGGPFLVDGPLEIELPDGTVVRSERPVVALCACRRSKRYPFCDTSHRRRVRASPSEDAGSGPIGEPVGPPAEASADTRTNF